MSAVDVIQSLGPENGDVNEGVRCQHAAPGSTRRFKDPNTGVVVEVVRPVVFNDYETNKSSVDISNNRRDNMIGFHDVLKTQRWELGCFVFFLKIVFSAFKHFRDEGEDVLHTTFRWRLVEGLDVHINGIRGGNTGNTMGTREGLDVERSANRLDNI
ncbi:hypothetical protein BC941DRAFT_518695 [Chlamydoabsidia padenii]|nr:hypothetical protein BC941DRAFT_518695 [Chlamydoabsidia padenii]